MSVPFGAHGTTTSPEPLMRLVRVHGYGGPETLRVDRVPTPDPGPGEVLLRIDACGVTLPAVWLTRGNPDGTGPPLPYGPGGDVVGLVERVGSGVSGWRVGQRVAGPAFRDAYATYVLVGSERLVEVPDVIEDGAAVSLVRAGQVALGALDAARLVEGEGLLVTAAAGAVGQLAVQLALLRGDGRVVSAVSSEAKATALRAAGHPEVATYAELASVEPVDAALDGVGGPVQDTVLSTLRPYGRLVTFGATGGPVTANELRMHSRSVIGFNMAHLSSLRAEAFAASRGELFERCRRGEIRPAVHAVLPLAEAGHAHRIMESRTNLGKVLLIP